MSKRTEKARLFADRIGRSAQINTAESFLLQLNSGKELSIKGCKTVLLCTDTEILLQCRYGGVEIIGSFMHIPLFSEAETTVAGNITDIRFTWEAESV